MVIEAKDDGGGGGGDSWTAGAVSHAMFQSYHHHQQINIQFFTGRMPFLSPNQQCQSTEGKIQFWSLVIIPIITPGCSTPLPQPGVSTHYIQVYCVELWYADLFQLCIIEPFLLISFDKQLTYRPTSGQYSGKGKGKVNHAPQESVGGCSSPSPRPWARRWRTTNVCDAWPVRRQTYGYLSSRKASPPVGWYPKLYCLLTETHVC